MQLRCDSQNLKGKLFFDYNLQNLNSWRVGGASDCFYTPSDVDDLSFFLEHCIGDEAVVCLGLGSNVLIRDEGVRGVVISMSGAFSSIKYHEDEVCVRAESGVPCAKLARFCAAHGLQGLEFLAGVPGTVGGALAMNAGAFGSETWQCVDRVQLINRRGEVHTRTSAAFDIDYRSVAMQKDTWFVAGYFKVQPDGEPEILHRMIRDSLRKRNSTQPVGKFNCGSVFKNPQHDYAARLIESCGLKCFAIGGAQVSSKHANFIINQDNASATDIENLIKYIQKMVAQKTGIKLELEVKIIGGNKC